MNRAERRRRQKQAEKRQATRASTGAGAGGGELAAALQLARQHLGAGRLGAAEQIYGQILKAVPNTVEALHHLGVIAVQKGQDAQGIHLMSQALSHAPDAVDVRNDLGIAYKRVGNFGAAMEAFAKVLEQRPDMPQAHTNMGNVALAMGRADEAVGHFARALKLTPEVPSAHYNLGAAYQDMGEWTRAGECYEKALALDEGYVQARVNLATVFEAQDRTDAAETAYRAALAKDPAYMWAHHGLIDVLDRTNQTEALGEAVDAAKGADPGHPVAILGDARLAKRQGDMARAREILDGAFAGGHPAWGAGTLWADAHYVLGDVCDRLGDFDAAFAAFRDANASLAAQGFDPAEYCREIERVAAAFTPAWVASWPNGEIADDDHADPVFLVGFPRSGTTLLDTILRSHGAFEVIEEQPLMFHARQTVLDMVGTFPQGVAELSDEQIRALRAAYFDELAPQLNNSFALIVDKFPLNLVEAGLIRRMFPRARFVLALRHPCDCVLSCFMQNFALNEAMANFLDMEDAARLYDTAMEAWTHYEDVLDLNVHQVRYEDVVADFEGTIRQVLGFLGVAWNDDVRRYRETAQRRGRINTPSYDQVTQPIYTRASGRWENYRSHMAPVLDRLAPWAERFGYEV